MIGRKNGSVVMGAKGTETFERVVGEGNVFGLKDITEDGEDGWCKEVKILGTFLDDGFANVESNLNVPVSF